MARNTHRHTYTYYTHYTHTHTLAHTHNTHTHQPGTPGVLPGCSQGTHGVRRRYLCPASDPRYRGCGRAQAERPEPTSLLPARVPRVPLKFALVPSCGNPSVVSAEVWGGPCEYP